MGSGPMPMPPPAAASAPPLPSLARRSSGLFVATLAAGLFVIVAAVVLIVLQPWRSPVSQGPAAPPPPVLAVPAVPVVPASMPALQPARTAAAKVKLKVESDPAGAEVYRAADGVLVGRTPVTVEMTATLGLAVFIVKRAGHQDGRAELSADRDGATLVRLTRVPAGRPAAKPAAKVPEPAKTVEPGTKPPPPRKRVGDSVVDPFGQ
jgi:hypothetical protein